MKDDESLVYFASKTLVGRWTPANGVDTLASGFVGLGNLIVDGAGQLLVTDRDGNQVYRVSTSGGVQAIAGNGTDIGGGDGESALDTALLGVRGIWPLPGRGYFLATHAGKQVRRRPRAICL